MPNFVIIGQTVSEIWRLFDFSRPRSPPSWIFKILFFNGRAGQECRAAFVTVPNFVAIGQTVADIMAIFRFFQDGGRPPSWICDARVWTTHEEYLVVFIAVQNLVGIGFVVLKICELQCQFVLKMPIHAPFWGVFESKTRVYGKPFTVLSL